MSSYIDLKFINDLSGRLSQFKKKTDYLFNFRCPHCGDSQKSKTKARAYFYRVKNDMFFKCHNCSASHNLANFIKLVDRPLYDHYILERYKGTKKVVNDENLFERFIKIFIEAGKDVNCKQVDGSTFLDLVSKHRKSEAYAKILQTAGAEIELGPVRRTGGMNEGSTELGCEEMGEKLLEHLH